MENEWFVSVQGDAILIMRPPVGPISKRQALELAAWIVALADPLGKDFEKVREQVESA